MLARGTTLSERYAILEVIGSGGYGTVYRAEDRERKRTVAIKTLRDELAEDADYIRRFEREARIASMLDSRHVIRIFETGSDTVKGRVVHYQVMEYVDGATLQEAVQNGQAHTQRNNASRHRRRARP